ncbi:DNA-binding transcriptional LysR family regulator [Deinococcus metalli]|uniref:DNA-binding transcriptional LysR family regulator n=1 Tax=Deinococcus metalli TaxID=1141878 RepID=A0A7W8KGN2_9DEIO|nr:LysR family transcriptional regulator [Deinococcus metalli]MBB5377862.1 DNA-binding transcriptional LysR family regulator [Deinococcus metalli]GHF55414.1 transcriptional regulator [Deinococcus metalli]
MATGKSTPHPTLSQLRALLAVADAGGFSEAAAELGVSQSSLSEAVGKLEDVVGRPLLRRSPAGTVVTPAGARVLAHARTAVQAAGDVLLAAQDDQALSGVLRVASFRSTATHLLPPVLAAFRREHPDVTVRLLDGEADGGGEAQVRDGQADLALVVGEEMPGLRLTPLLDDEYLFVAPESRGTQPVTFEEVAGSALLLPPGLNSCHVRVQSYLRPLGISPAAVTEIDQDSVILGMVRHGLGVTVMPRLALLPLPDGLVALPLPQSLTRPLAVAALPHRAHLPVIRTFTAALVASLGAPDTRMGSAWRAGAALLH